MTSTSTLNATARLAETLNTPKSATSSAQEQSDRFMKLLVAQLKNQDPMNPMDNAQMTSQMAQISTVSGIEELNASIKSMTGQFTSLQVMQGASMIGREVLTEGNTMSINNGVAKGAMDLSTAADRVTVEVLSPGGQLLDTLNLGAKQAGRLGFDWTPPAGYQGGESVTFKVSALQNGKAIGATALARNMVDSVSTQNGTLSLSLRGAGTVSYDAIKAIL